MQKLKTKREKINICRVICIGVYLAIMTVNVITTIIKWFGYPISFVLITRNVGLDVVLIAIGVVMLFKLLKNKTDSVPRTIMIWFIITAIQFIISFIRQIRVGTLPYYIWDLLIFAVMIASIFFFWKFLKESDAKRRTKNGQWAFALLSIFLIVMALLLSAGLFTILQYLGLILFELSFFDTEYRDKNFGVLLAIVGGLMVIIGIRNAISGLSGNGEYEVITGILPKKDIFGNWHLVETAGYLEGIQNGWGAIIGIVMAIVGVKVFRVGLKQRKNPYLISKYFDKAENKEDENGTESN